MLTSCEANKIENNWLSRKGSIQYYFKGMQMKAERAMVVDSTNNTITALRECDNQLIEFVRQDDNWLLKGNTTNKSVLFGTRFIFKF